GVVDWFHVLLAIQAFLSSPQARVTNVRGNNLQLPWRRDERLRRRHVERQRIPQVVVGQRVTNQNGDRVRLLSGRTSSAPNTQCPVTPLLLPVQDLFQDAFLQQIWWRSVSTERGSA